MLFIPVPSLRQVKLLELRIRVLSCISRKLPQVVEVSSGRVDSDIKETCYIGITTPSTDPRYPTRAPTKALFPHCRFGDGFEFKLNIGGWEFVFGDDCGDRELASEEGDRVVVHERGLGFDGHDWEVALVAVVTEVGSVFRAGRLDAGETVAGVAEPAAGTRILLVGGDPEV